MDELDVLYVELLMELETLPEECPELRQLWLRTLAEIDLAQWEQRNIGRTSPARPAIH